MSFVDKERCCNGHTYACVMLTFKEDSPAHNTYMQREAQTGYWNKPSRCGLFFNIVLGFCPIF